MGHPFFASIDWDKLLQRGMEPPFRPQTESSRDTTNVDEEFLNEDPKETPVEMCPIAANHNRESLFENFSFVNENSLAAGGGSKATSSLKIERKSSFEDGFEDSKPGE